MGYTIKIGNAIPYFEKNEEYGELYAEWRVENVRHPDAPTFPVDEMTGNSNSRHPSYTGWNNFCEEAGVYNVFYENERFRGGHPGCSLLKKSDLELVREAKIRREHFSKLSPGFNDDDDDDDQEKYDGVLARLIWLEYWIGWALTNCETPAIENS
jgi:hypothetical protein